MRRRPTTFVRLPSVLAATVFAVACRDSVGPDGSAPGARPVPGGVNASIVFDQRGGSLAENGMALIKGFDPKNPRRGDAIVVSFFWLGSTNIITSVTDHLANGTPVGNAYTLVEYVTAGGISMATYVAPNVQHFPDANDPAHEVLVVHATLASPVADGGVMLSSFTGVNPVLTQALGGHRSTAGTGSSSTTASPGTVAVNAGDVTYAVTLSNATVGVTRPSGFAGITTMSDDTIKVDGAYLVHAGTGSVEPRWTWSFTEPSTWVATVLTLAPSSIGLDQRNGSLGEAGMELHKGFNPVNPRNGDAIVATFFWLGSTNIIDSVGDYLSQPGYPAVGNAYSLVEYVTAGGISMATYVATNVQNFPGRYDASRGDSILVVRAHLSSPITDGGVMLSAYTGVQPALAQGVGAHRSASGTGSTARTATPGAIALGAGALAYAVTLSNAVVGLDPPSGFANITTISDDSLKADGEFTVYTNAGSLEPQWTWAFNSPGTWLATALVLNPAASP